MSYRPNVIIADSSESFLVYMSTLLGRMNFEVLAVKDAAEAFDLAGIVNPNLIFLEAEGDGDSGINVMEKICKDNLLTKIPVIMTSPDITMSENCFAAGCSDFLTKPIDLTHLHTSLQKCLPNREGMRKHLRTTFNQQISFEFAGLDVKAFALTLSEGGVYLRTSKPLPVGSQVKVNIPVQTGETVVVNGTVVYTMGLLTGRFLIPPGMAIQFDATSDDAAKLLSKEVCRLLVGDIVEEQEEPVFKCTRGQ